MAEHNQDEEKPTEKMKPIEETKHWRNFLNSLYLIHQMFKDQELMFKIGLN